MAAIQFQPASLFVLIFVTRAVVQASAKSTCQDRLGVEDGWIGDSQITASTEFAHSVYHGANNARLNRVEQKGTTGAWSAQTNDGNQWIQAALGDPTCSAKTNDGNKCPQSAVGDQTWVIGVLIQGRHDASHWVTQFKVQYSNDGDFWRFVQQTDNHGEMVFDGNTDQNTVVTKLFPTPVKTSYIRIIPTAWNGHISLRFELLGCKANACQNAAGVEDGRIHDSQLKASTEYATAKVLYHRACNARLNCPGKPGTTGHWGAAFNDINQWIQAEMAEETLVTGVMIQGRPDAPQWVSKFKIQYSLDGNYWKFVQTPDTETDMVFDGNTDSSTVVLAFFPSPVRASFIRIRPTAWDGNICMRFEVLAC
ncbi:EGF-like repeat and discoidin I-like domain-containing protein 3 [Amphiura filiformis]|uniref:EGF-like repeat and discoidin I-like domain-containing protein 3 n=1 Tax=Amphiura filiformis TaxID=82378 RepID=UPI003B226810